MGQEEHSLWDKRWACACLISDETAFCAAHTKAKYEAQNRYRELLSRVQIRIRQQVNTSKVMSSDSFPSARVNNHCLLTFASSPHHIANSQTCFSACFTPRRHPDTACVTSIQSVPASGRQKEPSQSLEIGTQISRATDCLVHPHWREMRMLTSRLRRRRQTRAPERPVTALPILDAVRCGLFDRRTRSRDI